MLLISKFDQFVKIVHFVRDGEMKKSIISIATSVALSTTLVVAPAFADDQVESSFDLTFGTSGVVRISHPDNNNLGDITALPDGEIFVWGESLKYRPCGATIYAPMAALLDRNENLKPGFADSGLFLATTTTQCENQRAAWAFENSDGKIWMGRQDDNQVSAFQMDSNSNNVSESVLAALSNVANQDYSIKAITATDGKFYVVGKTYTSAPRGFIARFTADGSLDSSFNPAGISGLGQAGVMLLPFGFEPSDVKLLSDNGALVSGQYSSGGTQDGVVLRVSATGTYVNTFGVDGVATFPEVDWLSSIFVNSDETAIYAISNYVWILKIDLASGAISSSYGINGATSAIAGTNFWDAAIDPMGNIYVLTYNLDGSRYLIKIKNDGYIDQSFNSNGYFYFPVNFSPDGNFSGYFRLDYGSDGYIYLGGQRNYGFEAGREDIILSRIDAKLDSSSTQTIPSLLSVGSTWTPSPVRAQGIDRLLTSSTQQLCSFQNGTLTAIAPGTCRFTITDGGNSYWKQSVSSFEVTIPNPPAPVVEDRNLGTGTSQTPSTGSQVTQPKQEQSIGVILPATARSGKTFGIPLTTNTGTALSITASKFCKISKEDKQVTKLQAYNKKIRLKERYVVILSNGKQKTKTRTVSKEVVRYKKVKEREQTGWNLKLLKQGESCNVVIAAKESDGFNAFRQSTSIKIR
jgi:hypothetical protein